jgi:hypothetical protein
LSESPELRGQAFRRDYYDYKNAMVREKLIYVEETLLWEKKFEACKSSAGLQKNKLCRHLEEMLKERAAYVHSRYAKTRTPTLTPGLPDLGPPPFPEYYGLETPL